MELKQIMGITITILGMLCIGFGAYVLMMGETQLFGSPINRWEALVPLILGLVFFGSGVSLVRSSR
jgi:threonine/homoserine/homoserine lactone efflux protein